MAQVKIGPNFFAKEFSAYADWQFAWCRELAQNSIDCGSSNITIEIAFDGTNTVAQVRNDGEPMGRDTLVDKFLALGESGKDFAGGAVGGFGKAKIVICFMHQKYQIRSGKWIVDGCGGEYDITETPDVLWGTETTVIMKGDKVASLIKHFRNLIAMTQWRGTFKLNGETLYGRLKKGAHRRDLSWASIYTNNSFKNRLIVRIGGIPMFTRYISPDKCVLVEINRTSGEVLQNSRDSLQWDYQNELDEFVRLLSVDVMSALRAVSPHYTHYDGERIRNKEEHNSVRDIVQAAYATQPTLAAATKEDEEDEASGPTLSYDQHAVLPPQENGESYERRRGSRVSWEFVIKNTTSLQVPDYYQPVEFSSYSERLVRTWIKCLLKVHEFLGKTEDFGVGFIFDEERQAEREENKNYGLVYYINPAVIVKQLSSASRSFKKRWNFTPAGRWQILATAVHEVLHSDVNEHNELYASRLTTELGALLCERGRFCSCFS